MSTPGDLFSFIYTIIFLKSDFLYVCQSAFADGRSQFLLDRLGKCLSVGVRRRQVAILARSSREMSLTVRIV